MKAHVHLTPKVKMFILSKMCQGYNIWELCSKWPDRVPLARTIYSHSYRDPEFAAQLEQAYTVLIYRKIDQLHKLAKQISPTEAGDWRQSEASFKRQIDELKWVIGYRLERLAKRTAHELAIVPHIITIKYNNG